jgi:hypothetical protein
MCKQSGETIDHLLLHCKVARELWVSIFHHFSVEWVMAQRAVELLASWKCQFESLEDGSFVVHLDRAIVRYFEVCGSLASKLKAIMFKTLYVWMAAYNSSRTCKLRESLALYSSNSP